MKKNLILFVLSILLTNISLFAQNIGTPPGLNWGITAGGDGAEKILDMVTDMQGNTYACGSFSGSITVDGSTITSTGFNDMLLLKLSPAGNLLWFQVANAGPHSNMRAACITLDESEGMLCLTGDFDGNVAHFGAQQFPKTGITDVFAASYTLAGALNQVFLYGLANEKFTARRVSYNATGIYLLAGRAVGNSVESNLLRVNMSGDVLWLRSSMNNYADVVSLGNSFYLTGAVRTNESFGAYLLEPVGVWDVFLARGDTSGQFDWAYLASRPVGGSGFSIGNRIAGDSHGNIYVGGYFRANMNYQGLYMNTALASQSAMFVLKCSEGGTGLWAEGTTGNGSLSMLDLHVDFDSCKVFASCSSGTALSFQSYTATQAGTYLITLDSLGSLLYANLLPFQLSCQCGRSSGEFLIGGTVASNLDIQFWQADMSSLNWEIISDGNSGTAVIIEVEHDAFGNVYSLGTSETNLANLNNVSGAFMCKHDRFGNLDWVQPLVKGIVPVSYTDRLLACNAANEMAMAGYFEDTITIQTEQRIVMDSTPDIFVAKFAPNGNLLFLKQIHVKYGEIGSVCFDLAGNAILSGVFSGVLLLDGNQLVSLNDDTDAFLIKLDANGDYQWGKVVGGPDVEYLSIAATDDNNQIFLTGEFISRDISFGNLSLSLTESDGDVILAKFDADGNCLLAADFGDPGPGGDRMNCWPTAIRTSPDGTSYLYGWKGKDHYFGNFQLISDNTWNFFLGSWDANLNVNWVKQIKERTNDFGYAFDIDPYGNIYAGAGLRDTVTFDTAIITLQGTRDFFLARYDVQGNLDYVKTFINSGGTGLLYSLAAYDSSSLFIGGKFGQTLAFDTNWFCASANAFLALLGEDILLKSDQYISVDQSIKLFPNPNRGQFQLLVPEDIHDQAVLNIYNSQGKKIFSTQVKSRQCSINLGSRAPGLYLLEFIHGGLVHHHKFVYQQ